MPTSPHEAMRIASIINEYIGPRVAAELTQRLYEEVGENTSNKSLKDSLEMLYQLFKKE